MRLSDLRDVRVRSLDGKILGRVHDVHVEDWRIVALMCGAGSFVERLTARTHGRRIPWEQVVRIGDGVIVVNPETISRKPKSGASRTRQGTPRPSGRRSGR